MGYSVQPRGQIFVKSYGVLSFAKRIAKTISRNLSAKYSHKVFDHAKQSETHALKTSSKRVIQKTAKATDDLIGNKTSNRITKVSKCSPQNNSETITNEDDEEISRERYISPNGKKLLDYVSPYDYEKNIT